MLSEILLVRHGQTESNRTGYYIGWSAEDLNTTGIAQAQRLSSRLAGLLIEVVYSSPLQRAFTTASIIAGPHRVEVKTLPDLKEVNQGHLQGAPRSETKSRFPEFWKQLFEDISQATFPGGESFTQVAERSLRSFESIIKENPDKRVLIVSHEIVIKIIIMRALGVSYSIYRRFEVGNASLSLVHVQGASFKLITLNDKSHLAGID